MQNIPETDRSDEHQTRSVMKKTLTVLNEEFVKRFILGKHRSISDIQAIKKESDAELEVFESNYIGEADFNILVENNLAMALVNISELLLSELLLRILHNNGILLNELKYITNNDETSKEFKILEGACNYEYKTAVIVREVIEKEVPKQASKLVVCLRNKRWSYDDAIGI